MVMEAFCIAIDLGGTAIKSAIVSQSGRLTEFMSVPTEAEKGPRHIIDALQRLIAEKLDQTRYNHSSGYFKGVGIGMPGVVGLDSNTVSHPPNLPGWEKMALGDILTEKLKATLNRSVYVGVENDANLAALGEAYYGAGKGLTDFLMVTLGTGVGCGIILNKQLYKGTTGAAGELGHVSIQCQSAQVHAGIRGSLEGFVGQRKISALAMTMLSEYPNSILHQLSGGKPETIQPRHLTQAAEKGDDLALTLWAKIGEYLGVGLAGAISLLDIRTVVLGGGVSGANEFLFPSILKEIKQYILPPFHDQLKLIPATLGNDAGLMGAAAHVFSHAEKN